VLSLRVGVQAGVGMAKGTLQLRRPLGPQPTEARTVTDQQVATIDGTDEGSAPVPSIKKTERTATAKIKNAFEMHLKCRNAFEMRLKCVALIHERV